MIWAMTVQRHKAKLPIDSKKRSEWCFTIGIYNSKKIGMVGFNIGYAVLLSVLGISIAPMQL